MIGAFMIGASRKGDITRRKSHTAGIALDVDVVLGHTTLAAATPLVNTILWVGRIAVPWNKQNKPNRKVRLTT